MNAPLGLRRRPGHAAAALGFGLMLLCGCEQDLFSKQTEVDVNEMVGALSEVGIAATKKTIDSGKTWIVAVDERQLGPAMAALKARGLPQQRYNNLGEIFKKDGLISTPTEERVRFIYGVTQELSQTLSQIDGVVVARVHVVLPNNDPLASAVKPSSASVFVKYRPESNVALLVPSVKNLVVSSVEGLKYENVNVTLVPAVAERAGPGAPPTGTKVALDDSWWKPAVGLALLTVLVGALLWFWLQRSGGAATESPGGEGGFRGRLNDLANRFKRESKQNEA